MPDLLVSTSAVTVRAAPQVARMLLHCEPHDAAAAGGVLGVPLPPVMLRSGEGSGWFALHLAPDEWFLIGEEARIDTLLSDAARVEAPYSLVDVSDRALAFEIAGDGAETLLAAGCPLDLAAAAFPPGACTRTLFGKAPIMLWRREAGFWLECARSYRDYVALLLETAARELA